MVMDLVGLQSSRQNRSKGYWIGSVSLKKLIRNLQNKQVYLVTRYILRLVSEVGHAERIHLECSGAV